MLFRQIGKESKSYFFFAGGGGLRECGVVNVREKMFQMALLLIKENKHLCNISLKFMHK